MWSEGGSGTAPLRVVDRAVGLTVTAVCKAWIDETRFGTIHQLSPDASRWKQDIPFEGVKASRIEALMVCLAGDAVTVAGTAATAPLPVRTSLDFLDLIPSNPQTLDLVFSFLITLVTGGHGAGTEVRSAMLDWADTASCLGEGIGSLGLRMVELARDGSSTSVARAGTGDMCFARLISAWP